MRAREAWSSASSARRSACQTLVIEREPRDRGDLAQQCAVRKEAGVVRKDGDGAAVDDDRRDFATCG
jgi:hypothetical protein